MLLRRRLDLQPEIRYAVRLAVAAGFLLNGSSALQILASPALAHPAAPLALPAASLVLLAAPL